MKLWLLAISIPASWFLSPATLPAAEPARSLALLPQPLEVQPGHGLFVLGPNTTIHVDEDSAAALNVGRLFASRVVASTGLELKIVPSNTAGKRPGVIRITAHGADASLGAEGYLLEAEHDGVVIAASAVPGMFYGTQTLLQLLPPAVFKPSKVTEATVWAVPAVRIKDRPRFPWRGLLLDVARHFFTKDEVKNLLDLMAQHKLNTLHLHLTDDQGWRIEVRRYPKLTEIGAWRKSIGFGLDPHASTAYRPDGAYGGFYTQDDIRELVAYAQARSITIVPEIEMPGHSGAALSAYPELTCSGTPPSRDGGPMGIYCAGNDASFTFLQNVLAEVIDLFPGKYIHIGGDEVQKDNWKKCPKCQARIKQEGLKDERELQSYFVKRIERYLNSQGRTLIGWDEILEGGLAPNATVMSWRSIDAGVVAATAGHDVVMTPVSHCYFDYKQAKTGEPPAQPDYLPLGQVYAFDPLPPGVPAGKVQHILGAGGTLWSEYLPNYAHVQYMAFPRACALAEVAWSAPGRKNWDDFRKRLDIQLQRLGAQAVHYRQPKKDE